MLSLFQFKSVRGSFVFVLWHKQLDTKTRLRVVSNFGDGDYGAGEIYTSAGAKFRGDATRGGHNKCYR